MNKLEFIKYIEDPELLSKSDIPAIDELLNRFPYCQSLQLMKAKTLYESKSVLFDQQLTKAAAYAGSRKVLYYLMHSKEQHAEELNEVSSYGLNTFENIEENNSELETIFEIEQDIPQNDIAIVEPDNAMDLLEQEYRIAIQSEYILEDKLPEDNDNEAELIEPSFAIEEASELIDTIRDNDEQVEEYEEELYPETSGSMQTFTFGGWLKKISGEPILKEPEEKPTLLIRLDTSEEIKPLLQDEIGELILTNVFQEGYLLKGEAEKQIQKEADSKEEKLIENFIHADVPGIIKFRSDENLQNTENKARKSASEQMIPITETLAQIYLKQKLYQKAIDAYEKLSLKYPKKKTYFANLIGKIKSENKIK